MIVATPYPPQIAGAYSAMCAGPEGITVLDGFECSLCQHGLRSSAQPCRSAATESMWGDS